MLYGRLKPFDDRSKAGPKLRVEIQKCWQTEASS